ncbi:phosphomethylpyrimidine kinase [Desulfurococcus amylolyticus 1221n]|uniref:Phosphomethylpyrimidine kinase n=2 Tax=Desulfurococcus TaxID=2273 RepID=B8D4K9_DESA1|nr:bifunctional hydroxymethylpyrimidine kinase/phosphomethylpyrimidine kinase [Desulfurococcus amylolyticus]ACL11040.1 phosphomethylpyrimidine kinase [Desulfurococcus amylolyticus 1221n]
MEETHLKPIPVALTIAGSDSGGGAGIEADLKTFTALGVHGAVAVTSVTAQNTVAVTAIHDIPPEIVYKQIEAVAEDMGVDAAKTGMLSNSGIIEVVARAVNRYGFPLVVDPVMIAKTGARLLREDAVRALVEKLLPLAKVATPNKPEAEVLAGMEIRSLEDAKRAARVIAVETGVEAVVVKGGHMEGDESIDVLYWRGGYREYRASRVSQPCNHGGGCSFSAAIAAGLAKGLEIPEAVKLAKEFISTAISYGYSVGKGYCPVNPAAWLAIPAEKYWAIMDVEEAVELVLENRDVFKHLVPEVGMNIARIINPLYARGIKDVVAVAGRIVRYMGTVKQVGPVKLGASSHLARALLEAVKHNPELRAVVNVAYSREFIEKAARKGYRVVYIDRTREPVEVKQKEGASIPWIIREAFSIDSKADIVYDTGDIGKEAMIRVFAGTAVHAVMKILDVAS